MKIKVDAALCVSRSSISRVLQNTLNPYDLYVFPRSSSDPTYIAIADLPEFEVNLSAEDLVKAGLNKIAESREKLITTYQKGLQELRNQESDLQMLGYAPDSAEAEDITFNEVKPAEPLNDDIPL